MSILGGIAATVFGVLGLLHVWWALGGRIGSTAVIPTREGRRTFEPSRSATLAVAGALFAAALVVLHMRTGLFVLSLVFAARAIGNLGTVGFSKTVRGTSFARWDTWLYSPLCLALAALCISEGGDFVAPLR